MSQLAKAYRPSHDESARHGFVGALKSFVNGPLEARLAQEYETRLKPDYAAAAGHAPRDREEGTDAFSQSNTFGLWGSAVYTSQDLMWETVGETCRRVQPAFEARRREIEASQTAGKLELQGPDFEIPEPIASTEIHRQPGGYFGPADEDDLFRGLHYFGTIELYRAAKGLSEGSRVGEPGMGRYLLGALDRRFPDIAPKSVLDLGCGPGTETLAYKARFSDAETWGVDLSAPFLKFGHVWAEDQGLAVNFRQANAAETGFADGQFDLIFSHILFHETWHDVLPQVMKEAYRLLAPGGVFINGDTPYQPNRLSMPKQVTNHWQVVNNGEPFWTGYADTDIPDVLVKAGFSADQVFADYDPLGQGEYYIFGGRKDEL